MSESIPLKVLAYGMLGMVLSAIYLSGLRWNIGLYCGRAPVCKALLVHALRLAGAGAAFTACARQGAVPLLSSLAGFVAMRTTALHQWDGCSIFNAVRRSDTELCSGRQAHPPFSRRNAEGRRVTRGG